MKIIDKYPIQTFDNINGIHYELKIDRAELLQNGGRLDDHEASLTKYIIMKILECENGKVLIQTRRFFRQIDPAKGLTADITFYPVSGAFVFVAELTSIHAVLTEISGLFVSPSLADGEDYKSPDKELINNICRLYECNN